VIVQYTKWFDFSESLLLVITYGYCPLSTARIARVLRTMFIYSNQKYTGGILDLYIFLGPTPEEVVEQYTQVRDHAIVD